MLGASGSASRKPTVVTRPLLDLMREQRDRAQLDDIAGLHATPKLLAEIVGERHFGVIGSDLQAVDFGQRTERRRSGHEEVAKQPRIGRQPAAAS